MVIVFEEYADVIKGSVIIAGNPATMAGIPSIERFPLAKAFSKTRLFPIKESRKGV